MASKQTDLKVQVKRGKMTAQKALEIMSKRDSWPSVKNSRTGRWIMARA